MIFLSKFHLFIDALSNIDFTQTTLDFEWNTNIEGTTEMYYGSTEELVATNIVSVSGQSTSHSIDLSGLDAGEITWVQAFSVSGSDTAKISSCSICDYLKFIG